MKLYTLFLTIIFYFSILRSIIFEKFGLAWFVLVYFLPCLIKMARKISAGKKQQQKRPSGEKTGGKKTQREKDLAEKRPAGKRPSGEKTGGGKTQHQNRRQQCDGKTYGTEKFNNDDSIGTSSMIKFHGEHFLGKIPTVESPTIKTMTFIGYLKHVSSSVDENNSCGTLSQL